MDVRSPSDWVRVASTLSVLGIPLIIIGELAGIRIAALIGYALVAPALVVAAISVLLLPYALWVRYQTSRGGNTEPPGSPEEPPNQRETPEGRAEEREPDDGTEGTDSR